MGNKATGKSKNQSKKLDNAVLIAIIALISAVLGALINGLFGSGVIMTQVFATETPTITPSATVISTSTIPDPFRELTAIVEETQRAQQRGTAIVQLTQEADAKSTQEFLFVLQTVQADLEATRIYEQAQQQLATEQSRNAQATAQQVISSQQTATAMTNQQGVDRVQSFANSLPSLPVSFFDTFEQNNNGWSPISRNDYSVSMKDDILTVHVSDPTRLPFLWTCDKCDSFSNFSYQIDIRTPKGAPRIVSGFLFGSPIRFDNQPFQEAYALSIYSSGAVLLERISHTGRDIVKLWDHRPDLITPDGNFHNLQIVAIDKYAAIYVDGKLVGDIFSLDYSTSGYIGIVIQSTDVDIEYDNLKIVESR